MQHVSIEITQKCPNRCIHCSSVANKESDIYISTKKIKEIINGLSKINTKSISISGGEPFIHPGLIEIVNYAISKNISVDIYTSGIMLDRLGIECSLDNDIINKMSCLGINKLVFNVQALRSDLYDEIMQTKGNLPLLIESIKRCKKSGIFTEIHFVPMKINIDEIDSLIKFSNEFNIDTVSFLGLIPHGRARNNKERLYLNNESVNNLKKKLKKLKNKNIRIGIPLQTYDTKYKCYAGKEKLYIKFDGTVYGCEAFKYIKLFDEYNNQIKPDSIYNRDIESIFIKSNYLEAEEKFIRNQQRCFKVLEKCPVQTYIRFKEDN